MRLSTIGLISTLVLGLLSGPSPAEAQQAEKVYRIGWLRFFASSPTTPTHVAFRQRLRELGYVEGQNLVIEYRSAKGKPERRSEMAVELVRLKVDVIVASPAPPIIRAAQGATRTIPIVMAGAFLDPVEAGFVQSLARPGGNITGITNLQWELHPKRLELLKEAFPRISRVAILWAQSQKERRKTEIEAAAQTFGIQIQSKVVAPGSGLGVLESTFSEIKRGSPGALLVADTWLMNRYETRIMEFTANRRLPTMYTQSRYVDAGGLMSYGTNLPHLFRQAATYVDKILKGAKTAELPVERPTKFDLVINLKRAKQLGITIPSAVLYRADEVIK